MATLYMIGLFTCTALLLHLMNIGVGVDVIYYRSAAVTYTVHIGLVLPRVFVHTEFEATDPLTGQLRTQCITHGFNPFWFLY